MSRPKETKAYLYETIEAECPHCGGEYRDTEPGWRDKPQENGKSFTLVRCQKGNCRKSFRLNFIK